MSHTPLPAPGWRFSAWQHAVLGRIDDITSDTTIAVVIVSARHWAVRPVGYCAYWGHYQPFCLIVVATNVVDPALIERWQGIARLIVIDAVVSGAAPGTMHCFNLSRESLPGDLAALLDLARALDRLPPQVRVFGVEAHDFTPGQAVSEAVLLGVTACVKAIVDLLNDETE